MRKPAHEPAILQGAASCSLSQAHRAFQNLQRRSAASAWCFTAFSERADSLDRCACRIGLRTKSCWSIASAIGFLLRELQTVLADGALRATGFLALFYSAVLFTEGIGVYLQQRWAELLMIFATAALIPIEVRHLLHDPGLVGALILLANCFIVWFLYRVLKRDKPKPHIAQPRELVETV